ncbi:hypothetical protein C0215_19095 [Clostridioides difficile]|nr:hypothetical protein C0215_19095 [Clostridioides difficile]
MSFERQEEGGWDPLEKWRRGPRKGWACASAGSMEAGGHPLPPERAWGLRGCRGREAGGNGEGHGEPGALRGGCEGHSRG